MEKLGDYNYEKYDHVESQSLILKTAQKVTNVLKPIFRLPSPLARLYERIS